MLVTKKSILSGNESTMELDITQEQLAMYETGQYNIQEIFPEFTPDQREFLISGITAEEWDNTFGEEE